MISKTKNKGWITLAMTICATLAVAAVAKGEFRVLERIEIGGQDAGYDYLRLDAERKRLFVAHGSRVEVLDTTTGKIIDHDAYVGICPVKRCKGQGSYKSRGVDARDEPLSRRLLVSGRPIYLAGEK